MAGPQGDDKASSMLDQEPVAFLGGAVAGALALDLKEDPLKSWLASTAANAYASAADTSVSVAYHSYLHATLHETTQNEDIMLLTAPIPAVPMAQGYIWGSACRIFNRECLL